MTDEVTTTMVGMTRMAMGSDVPEWLLTIEPDNPHARKGAVRFLVDVSVLDAPKCYFVIPDRYNGPCVDMSQVQGCRVFASSKEVRFAVNQEAFFTEDINAWQSTSEAAQQNAPTPNYSPLTPYGLILEAQRAADAGAAAQQRRLQHPPGLFRRWWLALFG